MGQKAELVLIRCINGTNKENPSRFIIVEMAWIDKTQIVYFNVILPTVSRFLSFTRSA